MAKTKENWVKTVSTAKAVETVPICYVHMDGTLADAELLGGGAHRGSVLYDVKSQAFGPLLHVFFQTPSLPASDCSILCGGGEGYAFAESVKE